jgi:damage-control phosphatase, subfamily I
MKPFNECIPCYAKQMLSVLQVAEYDKAEIPKVLFEAMDVIKDLPLYTNPAFNSSLAVLEVYGLINNNNPYKFAKSKSNDFALSIYDDLKYIVDNAEDKLLMAFNVAVAGNIIDMGVSLDFDITQALSEITTKKFDYCDYNKFKSNLNNSNNVLILGDNAGEIVFDKLLVEQLNLLGKNVTYAVKSFPIINDATIDDAYYVEMNKIADVIETGSVCAGVNFEDCSLDFIDIYKNSDIVIAKGQANYESLEDSTDMMLNKTYFVLRAKCPCIAKHIGVKLGDIVLKNGRGASNG